MRIVHTSDWHAGRRWKGRDRLGELVKVLTHMADFIRSEKVDLVLITGDLFDTGSPPSEAERAVFQFLRRVNDAGAHTVIIAGNHDAPKRLEAWGRLAELGSIHVVGHPRGAENGGRVVIERPSGERAIIAAVPFANAGEYVSALDKTADPGQARQAYAAGLSGLVSHLAEGFRADTVNLVMAHTHIEGAILAGSERRVHIGEQWAVTPQSAMPASAHYVALGHLHKPQLIPGAVPAAYAGSPMQLDFGEVDDEKRFVFLEAHPRLPVRLESMPCVGARRLANVDGTVAEIESLAPGLQDVWSRVRVKMEGPDVAGLSRLRACLPNAVSITPVYPAVARSTAPSPPDDGQPERPVDRFRSYLARRSEPADPALLEAFEQLLAECGGVDATDP